MLHSILCRRGLLVSTTLALMANGAALATYELPTQDKKLVPRIPPQFAPSFSPHKDSTFSPRHSDRPSGLNPERAMRTLPPAPVKLPPPGPPMYTNPTCLLAAYTFRSAQLPATKQRLAKGMEKGRSDLWTLYQSTREEPRDRNRRLRTGRSTFDARELASHGWKCAHVSPSPNHALETLRVRYGIIFEIGKPDWDVFAA